jgi:molybdopterin converting factor small subunit
MHSKDMKIKVIFHGILSDWAGVADTFITLPPGETLGDLLLEVHRLYGPKMPFQLRDKNDQDFFQAFWIIKGVERIDEITTRLREGDELRLLLPMAGG